MIDAMTLPNSWNSTELLKLVDASESKLEQSTQKIELQTGSCCLLAEDCLEA